MPPSASQVFSRLTLVTLSVTNSLESSSAVTTPSPLPSSVQTELLTGHDTEGSRETE